MPGILWDHVSKAMSYDEPVKKQLERAPTPIKPGKRVVRKPASGFISVSRGRMKNLGTEFPEGIRALKDGDENKFAIIPKDGRVSTFTADSVKQVEIRAGEEAERRGVPVLIARAIGMIGDSFIFEKLGIFEVE